MIDEIDGKCILNESQISTEDIFFVWFCFQLLNYHHRYLIEVDCSLGQFKSAKLKHKECTKIFHNNAKKEGD